VELIDLQLLVTHIIGFLIVLWLLRRFAWRPILAFLQARADKVVDEVTAAEEQNAQATKLREQYQAQIDNIEAEARRALAEARAEGREIRARMEAEVAETRRTRLERIAEEVQRIEDSARETLRRRTVDLALLAAERAVRERADDAKQRELIERFINEVGAREDAAGGA
jgi:F-type H+-transporting ATPase subunit b